MTKITKTYKIKSVITPPPPPPPPPVFPPPPPSSGIVKIATVGDWDIITPTIATVAAIKNKMPDASHVLGLGDNAYTTGATAVNTWWNIIGATAPGLGPKFKGILGNHDVFDGDQTRYAGLYKVPLDHQYVIKVGNVGIVSINTEIPQGSASAQNFVKGALSELQANSSIDWIIPVMHKPMYAYCWLRPTEVDNSALHPLFDQYSNMTPSKLHLVLCGHMHGYERSFPLKWGGGGKVTHPGENHQYWVPQITDNVRKNNYINPQGQIYVIAGMAGRALYPFRGNSAVPDLAPNNNNTYSGQFSAFCPVNCITVKNNTQYGFLGIQVDGKKLTGTFHANNGSVLDTFSITMTTGGGLPSTLFRLIIA